MNDWFDDIWDSEPFRVPSDHIERVHVIGHCPFALMFQAWVALLVKKYDKTTDLDDLNQMKVAILDRYFQFRAHMPRNHRWDDVSGPDHLCVFSVFERSIVDIIERQLSLPPEPPLRSVQPAVPHNPPSTSPPIEVKVRKKKKPARRGLTGILFGDFDNDGERE